MKTFTTISVRILGNNETPRVRAFWRNDANPSVANAARLNNTRHLSITRSLHSIIWRELPNARKRTRTQVTLLGCDPSYSGTCPLTHNQIASMSMTYRRRNMGHQQWSWLYPEVGRLLRARVGDHSTHSVMGYRRTLNVGDYNEVNQLWLGQLGHDLIVVCLSYLVFRWALS